MLKVAADPEVGGHEPRPPDAAGQLTSNRRVVGSSPKRDFNTVHLWQRWVVIPRCLMLERSCAHEYVKRISVIASLLVLLMIPLFSSCADKSTAPDTDDLLLETRRINWVGTDVLYSSTIQKKNLSLLMFLTPTCNGCMKYRRETLRNADVIKIIGESYNTSQVNPTADSQVVYFDRKVNCESLFYSIYYFDNYPALVVLDRQGFELDRITGYRPPVSFIPYLDSIRRVNR